jgi:antitoxin PrlF
MELSENAPLLAEQRHAVKEFIPHHDMAGGALTARPSSITFTKSNTGDRPMATTVTVKGQVTLPKKVREAAGIRPGDSVEVRATATGVLIEKPRADDYRARLYALGRRGLIRDGMTTDAFMRQMRGDPDRDPGLRPQPKSPGKSRRTRKRG